MKNTLLLISICLTAIIFSCKKNEPSPTKQVVPVIKGLHGNGSSPNKGVVGCKLFSYSDQTLGGYLFTTDMQGHVIKSIKLDTNGNQGYENIVFDWSGDKLMKVTYSETGYWSEYVNTYTGKYITSTHDTNNRNTLVYNYFYNYDSTGNLVYALQIQGTTVDSVAYHNYVKGRPSSKDFYVGTVVSSLNTVSGVLTTVTSHYFKKDYSYNYIYDGLNNRTLTTFIEYDGNGSELLRYVTDSSSYLFPNPSAGLIYNYGSLDNPNPNNSDQDSYLPFNRKTYSNYPCQGLTPISTSRLTSQLSTDSILYDSTYKCLYKVKYTKIDNNSCAEKKTIYSIFFSY